MADTLTFAVPVEWSKTTAYEQNIIVFVGKRAYTSLKAVPSGVEITDTSYWAETGVPKGSATTDAYTKEEVDEKLNLKATFYTRSSMDADLAKVGIATPLDYANAKNLMVNAGVFFSDDSMCANILAMAEIISALCAQIDGIEEGATKTSVAANAAAHNAIYRGKDITSMATSGELYVNIANGTFDDIYIGDYFTKSINGTNYVLRIAAFNYYYNMGDTTFTKPHAVIIPDSVFELAKMNSSAVVTGGYVGTKMRTETLQTWLSYLKTAFGSHLLTPRCLYDNACNGSSYSGAAWYDGPLELMTEEQVYGARQQGITNHSAWCYPGIDNAQFPLFALDHSRICNHSNWWLRSVGSSTEFSFVGNSGGSGASAASDSLGVRPRFLIG